MDSGTNYYSCTKVIAQAALHAFSIILKVLYGDVITQNKTFLVFFKYNLKNQFQTPVVMDLMKRNVSNSCVYGFNGKKRFELLCLRI